MAAVVAIGWAKLDVFGHQPCQEAIKLKVPLQRLMLKLADDQPQFARHFYSRPETLSFFRGSVLLTSHIKGWVGTKTRRTLPSFVASW